MTHTPARNLRIDRIDELRAEVLALLPIVAERTVQERLERAWGDVDEAVALLNAPASSSQRSPLALVDALLGLASSRLAAARRALEGPDGCVNAS